MEQTQIITPWVFYWIDIISKINVFSYMAITGIFFLIGLLTMHKILNEPYEDELRAVNKLIKKLTALFIVCLLVAAITPAKSTMYKMLIANEVTYERAETVIQVIDEKVEAIISSTKEK